MDSQNTMNSVQSSEIESKKSNWFSMKNRIEELVKQVSPSNIQAVAKEILKEKYLLGGRGLFCNAVMKSQMDFPELSNIYAALVAIINSEFPDVGLLLVNRVVYQFIEVFNHDPDKKKLRNIVDFIANLANQLVVYEHLAMNVLFMLLGDPSSDNVEIAARFCIQCGSLLQDFSLYKLDQVLEEFRRVLKVGKVEKCVQVSILRLLEISESNFENYPRIVEELDFVEEKDQVVHYVSVLNDLDIETDADDFNQELMHDGDGHGFVNQL